MVIDCRMLVQAFEIPLQGALSLSGNPVGRIPIGDVLLDPARSYAREGARQMPSATVLAPAASQPQLRHGERRQLLFTVAIRVHASETFLLREPPRRSLIIVALDRIFHRSRG